jgi:uncharacterized protein (DUF885 family)
MQTGLSSDLPELPAFWRFNQSTPLTEGWALYAEGLADELGLYSSDVQRLGMLALDAWRASRLVVDTGLHARGWSRDEAISFMRENTALSPQDCIDEVDRYIDWPGEALSYKVGEQEIRALRRDAVHVLGDAFDLRAFHDVVLMSGNTTLPLIRERVKRWLSEVEASR